ncbi:unnamed protein product [Cylindrotheca closterium]|uniref:Holocytochrome c-type synthase n=1 Tax=Cylindrotheca closterium TaxID=2856 RepID=A0AAD2CYP2_9STRA|nr:unnamed protein product [Cylindrotheca closterium]
MGGSQSKDLQTPQVMPSVEATSSATILQQAEQQEAEKAPESKCPMHKSDGSYSFDWRQMFKAAEAHGPSGRKPLSKEQQDAAKKPKSNDAAGGCPVVHDTNQKQDESSGCPVHPKYNVYSQPIDKTNQMPKGVKTQLPTAMQREELSTSRVSSTIPKGGGDDGSTRETWTYPSPQQFYNALARKGKLGDDTAEEDMESVVALHNNMNEKTWAQVVEWEKQTYGPNKPKLLKFAGRPTDLSPKAMVKHYLLNHPLPFDRHDWTVLRDNGETVRYVIDYYYDETRGQNMENEKLPELHDRDASPTLLIDVRPALDGPEQLLARAVKMPYKIWSAETTFTPMPLKGTAQMSTQVEESKNVWKMIQDSVKESPVDESQSLENMVMSESDAKKIAINFSNALKSCRSVQKKVDSCQTEDECMKASMDLTMCLGPKFCPVQHASLVKTLKGDDELKIEAALTTLSECVAFQGAKRHIAQQQHPSIFK